MLEKLRNISFWAIDYIKDKEIKDAFNSLKIIDNTDSRDSKVLSYQHQALNNILKHALTTTDFYSHMIIGDTLQEFPAVDKETIKKQQNLFLSNKFNENELVTMKTSGSTGTPFTVFQNISKKKMVYAEVLHYCGKAGFEVGKKLIYLRAITSKNKKTKLKQFLQNEVLIDCSELSEKNMNLILNKLEKSTKKNGAMLLSYPSTYQAILDKIKENKEIKIYGIISSSELLHDNLRQRLSQEFNCNVFSRYANEENGILGQDSPNYPNIFFINEAHYYIEILDFEEDKAVKDGEVGRIVVTDLFNYAMPLIRYDTGDIGCITYVKKDDILKKAISSFGGRKVDLVFDTRGNQLSPYVINNSFALYSYILNYQFIQEEEKKYLIKVVAMDNYKFSDEIHVSLKKILGEDAIIKFEFLNEIPKLASGKYRYIINEFKRNY